MTTPNRPIRIGVHLQLQHADYGQIRRAAAEAENLGVDIVFNYDHFFPLDGDPNGKVFECWTVLGAWAESTKRVEIGALVTCNAYRNPDLLADMARTVDHISDGRLILGVGSGWFEKDFDEYGYPFGTAGQRLDDLAAAMPRIENRLARLNPPPTRKIPVLIGGGGEKKTLRIVAEHADIWHAFGDRESLQRKIEVLDGHCRAVGRDPQEIEHSAQIVPSPAIPADLLDTLAKPDELRELGFTLFTWTIGGPNYDLEPLRQWVAWRDKYNG
ncbi:putative F420-dependent oxidoreductase [Mycobacterium sp. MAA66]|jgi:probable F420-dependent oxidoreductase|uniref:LLM class F420-dependent oxidoreductase n=1 Tax=Mycobacterium sp. MAA66 TaxID=3156297 RepID=UPI003517CD4C